MVLSSHVTKSMRVLNEENCEINCYLEANCVSYNYGPAEDELYLCELSDKNHLQVPSDELEARRGFIYRPVTPNVCVTSPCASYSTCQTGYGEEGYRCLCPHGFHGDKCQLDIEECLIGGHNCSQNAICANVPGSFLCNCKPGYTGDGVDCTGMSEL
ncbi:protein kinase C-binding protein NELL2-like [Orbicella faveolata]|uniref:protein kinase C-binding protein NELL2-like n=1 Tax=Orbicella faveolata TaxID=48498 RepID=UPI0009E355B3|nr:protein kinase C-binding protein NELL2-like [Orbicella faveolata]